MADLSDSKWSETASLNTAASPDGLANGSLPSVLGPTLREHWAAVKTFWNEINGTYTATGNAAALAITLSRVQSTYVPRKRIAFYPAATNTGAMTLNVNALGAKSILRPDGSALVAGDVTTNIFTEVAYDGTAFRLITPNPLIGGKPVFTVDNDGAGSGLDADKLDAQEGTWYLDRANHTGPVVATTQALTDSSTAAATTAFVQGIVGSNGRRALTVSTSAPTGGADGDVWYLI